MKLFKIIISDKAETDIQNITNHIIDVFGARLTAKCYQDGLYATILRLPVLAGIRVFNPYVQAMFGAKARHITYKKLSIIYELRRNVIYVKRVIASSLIH
ncbi:MAG: hypothetical protein LBN93_07705 [Candidatus Symbiothrix sp.]|jgi:plasmid stabilization system protein ParE|nr:hypothetical protein [Candidatus Symbiothrix sp.]